MNRVEPPPRETRPPIATRESRTPLLDRHRKALASDDSAFRQMLESLDAARSSDPGLIREKPRRSKLERRSIAEDERRAHESREPVLDARPLSAPSEASASRDPVATRPEFEALFERAVRSLQVGQDARDASIVRLRLSLSARGSARGDQGECEVRLVRDASGLRASIVSDEPERALAFAKRVQREFERNGWPDAAVEVGT